MDPNYWKRRCPYCNSKRFGQLHLLSRHNISPWNTWQQIVPLYPTFEDSPSEVYAPMFGPFIRNANSYQNLQPAREQRFSKGTYLIAKTQIEKLKHAASYAIRPLRFINNDRDITEYIIATAFEHVDKKATAAAVEVQDAIESKCRLLKTTRKDLVAKTEVAIQEANRELENLYKDYLVSVPVSMVNPNLKERKHTPEITINMVACPDVFKDVKLAGMFSNEPSPGSNGPTAAPYYPYKDYTLGKTPPPGNLTLYTQIHLGLHTLVALNPGDEITWCYGRGDENYERHAACEDVDGEEETIYNADILYCMVAAFYTNLEDDKLDQVKTLREVWMSGAVEESTCKITTDYYAQPQQSS